LPTAILRLPGRFTCIVVCCSMSGLSSRAAAAAAAEVDDEYPAVNSEPPVNPVSVVDVADRPTAVNSLRFTRTCAPTHHWAS